MTSIPSAERCAERIRGIYGSDLSESPPVLQPMAVWKDEDCYRTIRIGPGAPASATDRFVLGVARARADAIVTTGRILRSEPALRHDLGDPSLDAWRTERAGAERAAASVVLTGRADLDFGHPLFGGGRVIVVTSDAVARELRARAPACAEVVGRDRTDLRETLGWLGRERGFGCISIEAGPSTSLDLYRRPSLVGELMLSVYLEPSLPVEARGELFLDAAEIDRLFPHRSECLREEESGRWSFRRFLL